MWPPFLVKPLASQPSISSKFSALQIQAVVPAYLRLAHHNQNLNLDNFLQKEGCWTYINREVITLCSGLWSGLFQGALDGCNGAISEQDELRATATPAS